MIPVEAVPLADFCQTGSGTTPSRQKAGDYFGGSIPWVKSGELRESEITRTEEYVTERALQETSLRLVPAGALLVAMYGATVGRVGILGIEATTNQAICHVIPNPKRAHSRYVFHALQEKAQEFVRKGVGGAQPNITQAVIRQTKILLPSLHEQERIAEILDQAEGIRRLRMAALERLPDLEGAIFHEMFNDVLAKGTKERKVSFSELVQDAKIGLVRGSQELSDEYDVPYLRMDAIGTNGSLTLDGIKRTKASTQELREYSLRPGDFLFNTRNSKELVGKTAIFRGPPSIVYNNNILRVRFKEDIVSEYVEAYFRQPFARKELELRKSGTTSVFAIYQKALNTLPVVLPSLPQQKRFAEALTRLARIGDECRVGVQRAQDLFDSCQGRAFRGEL